jgi:hypothetical protein
MSANLKVAQFSIEVQSSGEPGNIRAAQVSVEAMAQGEPGKVKVAQASAEVASQSEPGNIRVAHFSVEAMTAGVMPMRICPPSSNDIKFKPPAGTLLPNRIYSWRIQPFFGSEPGQLSECCTFQPVPGETLVAQFSVEVLCFV